MVRFEGDLCFGESYRHKITVGAYQWQACRVPTKQKPLPLQELHQVSQSFPIQEPFQIPEQEPKQETQPYQVPLAQPQPREEAPSPGGPALPLPLPFSLQVSIPLPIPSSAEEAVQIQVPLS
ncbi:UNVERIFIED_CONTAM: hypothetical protein FKN15_046702 [Acipenser sinensis]